MKRLFVFEGVDRCASATGYVLGEDEKEATVRLLRDDASPNFLFGKVYPFVEELRVTAAAHTKADR